MEWISSLLLIPAVVFGLKLAGLLGVVLGHALVMLLTTFWYFPWSLYQLANFDRRDLKRFSLNLIQTLVASVGCAIFYSAFDLAGWLEFIKFSIALILSYCTFLFVISKGFRAEINVIKSWFVGKLK